MFGWFKIKGYLIIVALLFGSYIVSDWLSSAIGLSAYGIWGTFAFWLVMALIVYVGWKKLLHKHIN